MRSLIFEPEESNMKLYIGENLKQLRLAKGLTQEELADGLGVSPQSVSRWEGGASYPDVELLPEIAGFFDVSVDALIGADEARQEARLREARKAIWEEEDREKRREMARKLCREFPHTAAAWITLFHELAWEPSPGDPNSLMPTEKRYAEAKKTAEKIFSLSRDNHVDFDSTVRCLVDLAPEREVEELLDQYAAAYDISRGGLLEHRYLTREDWPRYELWRQNLLLSNFRWWIQSRFRKERGNPPEVDVWAMTTLLRFVNLLTGYEGDALVDPAPDLWYNDKQLLAELLANAQAACGQVEDACRTLGEMLTLIENCASLPVGTVLTFRCPVLDRYAYKVTGQPGRSSEASWLSVPLFEMIAVDEQGEICEETETASVDIAFTNPGVNGHGGFDAIRDDPRFREVVKRAENLLKAR